MNTLLQLRYLIAAQRAVEEGSVRRAAKSMHISPAALLEEIHELEHSSGIAMFLDRGDSVELTEAGRAFLDAVSTYLLQHGGILGLGKSAATAVRQNLTIGRTPYTDPEIISALLKIRLAAYPEMHVQMYSDFSLELCEAVKAGTLDLAVIANPEFNENLAAVKISELPFYIALPRTHALAEAQSVTLADIRCDKWILFERKVHPGMYDAILHRAQQEGIAVQRGPHIVTAEEAFQFVSRNLGVAFANKPSARALGERGISVKPLLDKELRVGVYLMWRADGVTKLITQFVDRFVTKLPQLANPGDLSLAIPMASDKPPDTGVVIKHARGEVVLDIEKIAWIEAEDYYVAIHHQGRKYLTRDSVSSLAARLGNSRFIRVHRGALANLGYVREINSLKNGLSEVILHDGTQLRLSRRERMAAARALARWNSKP